MAVTKTKQNTNERAVGRRKTAAARIRIQPGTGVIVVNEKPYTVYFPIAFWQEKVMAPLKAAGRETGIDVSVRVAGGGVHAQADAVRHGIARALIKWDETLRPVMRAEGFLTRDPRAKERKKFGLHKARRGHQWRKR